ncbi:MAG: DUF3991 and toprim domain-containing protein [Oscillospiraceae bacterium]|jgi:hypothetical protein|nr:DUF3991 and toprim domain-containing protein [Oscillospiraceae bacterium]
MFIDKKVIEQARNTDMIKFLEKHCGFTFYTKRGSYRCKQHPSLAVKNDRLSWYWHSKSLGGFGVIDFLTKIEHMSFCSAVEAVTGIDTVTLKPKKDTTEPVTLFLPEKKGIPIRLYDYLCVKRGILGDIVHDLMNKGMLYEDKTGNVVFVARDENNKPRFASVRGTYPGKIYRHDCIGSDKRYGFNMTYSQNKELHIYESPIDCMSHASMQVIYELDKDAWKSQNRLSLGGTSDAALPLYLEKHPCVERLVFNLDNDEPGENASLNLMKKYLDMGYSAIREFPVKKDWNEDLVLMVEDIRKAKARGRDISFIPHCL